MLLLNPSLNAFVPVGKLDVCKGRGGAEGRELGVGGISIQLVMLQHIFYI